MIDPITYSELLSGDVSGNIYESFARLDAEGNVVPSLATSWVAHEDNRGFRFHLRADVPFHSGRTLTAADVKWSLEQLLIPGNRGGLNAWRRGQVVRLEAHDEYWGGRPAIDGVEFLIVPSFETAISMYEAGELDLAVVEQPFTRRVVKDARLEPDLLMTPAAQIQYLGMNQNLYEPFKDIRVREAICRAIDLEGLSRGLFHGTATPLAGQITEGVAGYNPENRPVSYDPERARALLAEAGYPGGEGMPPLAISAPEPNRMELAFYANQLKIELGIPVEVAVVERGTHLAAMNAGQIPFFPWAWSAAYPDGLYFLRDVWYGPSTYNRSRWQNDAFDALIERASETSDNESRYELYHQAEKILLDDWGTCPTIVKMLVALEKPYVEGVTLGAFRFLPFAKVKLTSAQKN